MTVNLQNNKMGFKDTKNQRKKLNKLYSRVSHKGHKVYYSARILREKLESNLVWN